MITHRGEKFSGYGKVKRTPGGKKKSAVLVKRGSSRDEQNIFSRQFESPPCLLPRGLFSFTHRKTQVSDHPNRESCHNQYRQPERLPAGIRV